MDINKLKLLITKNENAKLEFKEQWYHKSQKNEMIKDIIALVNGNPQTVGEMGYLIIGIEDKTKNIKEVELPKTIAELEQEILQNINNYTTPSITDISFELFIVDEKKILVISIPIHNYLISVEELLVLATDIPFEISLEYSFSREIYIDKRFVQNISKKYHAKFWTSNEDFTEYERSSFFGFKKETISFSTACVVKFNAPKSSFNYSSYFSNDNQDYNNYVICVRE